MKYYLLFTIAVLTLFGLDINPRLLTHPWFIPVAAVNTLERGLTVYNAPPIDIFAACEWCFLMVICPVSVLIAFLWMIAVIVKTMARLIRGGAIKITLFWFLYAYLWLQTFMIAKDMCRVGHILNFSFLRK